MKCPRCGILLNELMKAGVQVDVCDQCLGMWLDRGELEKIVARIRELERDQAEPRAPERSLPCRPATPRPPTPPILPTPGMLPKHRGWRGMLDIVD